MSLYPFVMAGGMGQRLWPLSTPQCPKAFLSLISDKSMLEQTLLRLGGAGFKSPSVICNQQHRLLALEHSRRSGAPFDKIILEPQGRSTAFSIAIAALSALSDDPKARILVLPCDHYIEDVERFIIDIKAADTLAQSGHNVIFGVPPNAPKTGYGYIKSSEGEVISFTEKPDESTARKYLEEGGYFWNAGICLFSARHIAEAIKRHVPEVWLAAQESWNGAVGDEAFTCLATPPIEKCPHISIDYAVLEKIEDLKMIELQTGWSDLGSWGAIYEHIEKEEQEIARTWGSYRVFSRGPYYLMKKLCIDPGAAMSLQYHNHRAEHWVVIRGCITVQKGEDILTLKPDDTIDIPVGTHHRIENLGQEPAEIIEVQTGDFLDETDIVRLKDGRGSGHGKSTSLKS